MGEFQIETSLVSNECLNLPGYERTLGLRRGDCIADRIWNRGHYLAARGVGVGRKILSMRRDERRRGSTSTSAGDDVWVGGWRTAPQNIFFWRLWSCSGSRAT